MKHTIITGLMVIGLTQGCSDINQLFPQSDRPSASIEEAVKANDVEFVEQWLSAGGDPDYVDAQGQSLLYLATGPKGGFDVMDMLLDAGANPDVGLVSGNYTPLMNASSWVNLTAVERLLEAGADPTLENSSGQTALETVGNAGGAEQEVMRRLEVAIEEAR
ncbi:ankyrin repeat domain-containing protein [Oscillatoria sp. FACHB-1407]|uniref:ankyrin repeat domain-containing protein n=1 Tax=Oscillatoria sp. FACHB-1407 TaxID=2692847 RepID=UPI0016871118|nr:ankyrin repeat domain-containing protein [Oscillatoria sp. FACHB-1407]MBD2459945.1 ankyrin repeat domain-containing protein [Oscillatoria sp. FACHB-1407]